MKKAERYIKESELQKIKRYLLYAIAGTIICFVGDWQLGAYMPSQTFAAAGIFPPFSSEWAQAQPARLLLGGLLGSLSLLIMFSGLYAIYLLLRKKQQKTAKCFLLFSVLFRLLPKNSITSAVFAWGQQNIGMLVTFLIYYAVRGYNREDNI